MPRLSDATRGRILFGGDYNPEQWNERTWSQDVRLMREAGVNLATVGVFSWSRLEPRPGVFDFGWLDTVLGLLHTSGIDVCLATPTASPPSWMGHLWPETLPRNPDGSVVWYGSRNQFCASSPVYRARALAVTEALAERYADHPALAMWHVNNEYCTSCWCDVTAEHFRHWLRHRYGGLDALNDAWGTHVWSQWYGDWSEILPPRQVQYLINPTQALDFRRFTSDALLECFTSERDVLRRITPRVPVTTNFMAFFEGLDCWTWAREEDLVSIDIHPFPKDPRASSFTAMLQDLTRSQSRDGSWMLMEQAPGAVNWQGVNQPKPAGMMRALSLQAVARGADGVCFFQWRQSRQGAERFHSAMVPHQGPGSRIHQRIKSLGAELRTLSSALADRPEQTVPAHTAVVHDWQNWWAFGRRGAPSHRMEYPEILRAWYHNLWEANLTTDFRPSNSPDLGNYRLVVVPNLYLADEAALENLSRYVANGGTLITGFFSGIVDQDDRVHPGGMAPALRDLLGLSLLQEWWPLDPGDTVPCDSDTFGPFTGSLWSEEIEPGAAEVLATFSSPDLSGCPAVTVHRATGGGSAWYVATLPEPDALRSLLTRAARDAGVEPVLPGVPRGVEAVRRGGLLFLVNHGSDRTLVPVPKAHEDVLTGEVHGDSVVLDRYGVAVLRPRQALPSSTS